MIYSELNDAEVCVETPRQKKSNQTSLKGEIVETSEPNQPIFNREFCCVLFSVFCICIVFSVAMYYDVKAMNGLERAIDDQTEVLKREEVIIREAAKHNEIYLIQNY